MSTKERYFVSTSFKLQKGVPLPPIRCHLSLEEGALVLVLEPGNQLMAIPYNTIMPFTVPKMASAKKITFDLQNHERYSQVSMVFEKSEQLKHVCELASQHIKVCTPKKATASQFTRQVESSSRGPPARSSASVPTTPSYTATVNSYSSTLQSNKSPRPSPLRLSSTPNRTTADALAEAWNSERNDEPTSSVRQNSARYGTSNNIGPRKRGFVPVIVESEIEPVDSGRVEPVEKRESETKRAKNDDVVTLDDDVPASNEDGFTIDEDEKKEEESNGRTLRRETNMTSPVKDTKSCWPTRRYGTSVFSFRSMANLGNSCYMNASLQALASLPLFVDGLFKAVPRKCNNRTELLISVVNVYRHIFTPLALQLDRTKRIDTKTRYLGKIGAVPRLVLEKVRKAAGEQIDEDMASRTQQDAQEFVGRLLDIIHDEIDGKSPLPKRESPSSDKENQEFVENDLVLSPVTRKPSRKSMEHRSIQMPWKKNMPKLREQAAAPVNPGKLFKVDCYNRLLCNGCGNVEKKEESAYEVQLGLYDGKSTISALLEAQFELHDVDWKCPTCSATASTASTSFHNVPEYLVIVLKRYGYDMSGGTKSNKKVLIDPHLYLGDMCDGSAKKNTELEKKSLDFSQGDANLEAKSEVVPDSVQNTPVKAFMRSPEKFPRGFVNSSPMKSAQRVRHPSHENNEPGPNGSQGSDDLFISEEEPEKYDPVSHIDDVKRVYHPDISLSSTPDKPASPPPQISDDEEEVEEVANVPMEYHRTEGPSYTLSAIVNHQGASLSHGHYTAYSFDLDRKIWYKCDDSSISEVRLDCVLEHSKSTCYLLMYRRRHPGDEDQF